MTEVTELPDDTVSELTNTDSAACQDDNEASGLVSADDLVPAINEAADTQIHAEVSGFKANVLAHMATGKILNRAKDALPHGKWTTTAAAAQFR